jgi:hypothetical protein
MEKHTILIGKVCKLCEKFAWYVLQGKSLYHLQINPTKQEYHKYYFFSRFDIECLYCHVTTTKNICSAV